MKSNMAGKKRCGVVAVKAADFIQVGYRIQQARRQKKVSQAELAKRIGMTQAAISLFEAGVGNMRIGAVYQIARALDVPVFQFFLPDGCRVVADETAVP